MYRYATIVTFQQTFRRLGTLEESNKYFYSKTKWYRFQIEASILPNGLVLYVSKHYNVSVAEIIIMQDMLHVSDSELEKSDM